MNAPQTGDPRRIERITFMLTKEEKDCVEHFAQSRNLPVGVFVRRVVLAQIQSVVAA